MPKKQRQESEAEQAERFRKEAQRLIDAGELDPAVGDRALDQLIRKETPQRG